MANRLKTNLISGNSVTVPGPRGAVYFPPKPGAKTSPAAGFSGARRRDIQVQLPPRLRGLATRLQAQARDGIKQQRGAALDALLTRSGIALGIMAFVSIGLGWLMAGRALRPVRTMNARARGISERNLHERLALEGPDDELKELGDTFDGLLARLEMAFESQRRFVANASHELRTPITVERTLVEVALADPDATVGSLRWTCERVLAASEQQERLIEALLTLARSQRGLESREEIDLAALVREVALGAPATSVSIDLQLAEASTTGDRALLERLVANLMTNAAYHNHSGGWVRVWTGVRDGSPTLAVANTGPVLAPDQVRQLTEPFRRIPVDRAANGDRTATAHGAHNGDRAHNGTRAGHHGLGLGLSIVDAIAAAHGARLQVTLRPQGGLSVEVRFPPASTDLRSFYTENQDVPAIGRLRDPGCAHR